MKRFLLLFFAIFGFIFAVAQNNLTVTQNDLTVEPQLIKKQIVTDLSDYNYEEVVKVKITNTENTKILLRWDKEILYQPSAWESQVCDKEASYPPNATTNYDPLRGIEALVELSPGESFDLYLTIMPYGQSGQCRIEIPFRLYDQPEDVLETIVFQINILDEETLQEQQTNQRPKIFPNPVQSYFSVSGAPQLGRIEIFNTLGTRIKVFDDPKFGDSFNVSDLPPGIYIISLFDKQGQMLRTLRLFRRNSRA